MKITIGHSGKRAVQMDIDVLLRTRLLVQADSGGGKSWLLRRLAEQLFGKVQVIILDPEGEFATLREKHGYVLIGKGGETPADTRSAALVAQKILELRASAVCDIYELKHHERHAWVKLFLNAMIDAPKKLWHPVVIIVDEAHVYCPEKGKGESGAYGAMADLCTRGRKRGYCAVFATQRLGALSKDASSMLQNRLIGPTFEDINRKRAAEVLGVLKSDERAFFKEIQLLEPGNFFALGRAISTERILFRVDKVATTHPEMGSAKHGAEPPPPPEKVKALLPKLADVPKEAEEKAKTVETLTAKVRELKRQLDEKPVPEVQLYEKKMKKEIEKARLEFKRQSKSYYESLKMIIVEFTSELKQVLTGKLSGIKLPEPPELEYMYQPTIDDLGPQPPKGTSGVPPLQRQNSPPITLPDGEEKLGTCERAVASFLFSNFERAWSKVQVGIMAGYSPKSSSFDKAISFLNARGIITREGGLLKAGAIRPPALQLDATFSVNNIRAKLGKCENEIFEVLLANDNQVLSKEDVAGQTASNYSPTSSSYEKALSVLSLLGVLTRVGGRIRLSDDVRELL